jgi:hypothetical protein
MDTNPKDKITVERGHLETVMRFLRNGGDESMVDGVIISMAEISKALSPLPPCIKSWWHEGDHFSLGINSEKDGVLLIKNGACPVTLRVSDCEIIVDNLSRYIEFLRDNEPK